MTTKAQFNAEDWTVVTTAPVIAAMRVLAADRGGTVRESVAISRAYAAAREQNPSPLLAEILATPPAMERGSAPRTPDDLRLAAPAKLRQAIKMLERVATDDEVVEYKRFVFSVAESVARAHREGGFLGVGGKEISEREQEALDEIAAVFDEPPDAPAAPAAPPADEQPEG
jgi:hypothetical protein